MGGISTQGGGVTHFFGKEPESMYFRFGRPRVVSVVYSSLWLFLCFLVLPHFKNVDTILSSWAVESSKLDLTCLSQFADPWSRQSSGTGGSATGPM